MKKSSRLILLILLVCGSLYILFPTVKWYFLLNEKDKAEASLSPERMKYEIGKKVSSTMLKLQEGKELESELGVDKDELKGELNYLRKEIIKYMRKMKIPYSKKIISFKDMESELKRLMKKDAPVEQFFKKALEDYYDDQYKKKRIVKENAIKLGLDLQGGAYAVVTVNFNHPSVKERYPNGFTASEKEAAIDSAVQMIENRINKYGISETSIQKLKDQEKIVINLPGVKEATELRQIIETAGVLEFKLVSKAGSEELANIYQEYTKMGKSITNSKNEILPEVVARLPADTQVLPLSKKDRWGVESADKEFVVVESESLLGQNMKITNAVAEQAHDIGKQGQYVVNFELGSQDAKKWEKVTGDNIGRQISIILDGVVLFSPVVQDRISGGRSQISLGSSPYEEVANLALILKTGSLSVPLEISEENSVGASLGLDTIRKGLFASMMGGIFVISFMILWYSLGGVFADVSVSFNIFFLITGLALLRGTLTLPGIAGIILTIGMAVDANIIIYERIKEEFRTGKSFKTSVILGFDRAFWTIFDSNLTTFAAAFGLSLFGTGPIKGFAVTLCLGIISTMFTALFVTRLQFDTLVSGKKDIISLRALSWRGR